MAQRIRTIPTRVELDHQTDAEFSEWSEASGRSKRRHASILLRKLAALRKSHPEELVRLGLLDRDTVTSR